jgi:type IV pilus assembly protein PilE
MKTLNKKGIRGFTIIELMIVLVIVAILLAIAYPSYVNYTRKAKRGEAQQLLLNWAINQEIFRSNNPLYADEDDAGLPGPVHVDGDFTFLAWATMGTPATCAGAATDLPTATAYWLVATAVGDQANDVARDGTSCATICMASTGVKAPPTCWE